MSEAKTAMIASITARRENFGKKTATINYSDGVIASYPFRQRMDFLGVGVNYRF